MSKPQQNARLNESPEDFAARLGLHIDDQLLLSRALTHRSYLNEHPEAIEDNERLEFLGDAVLDFLVAAWLYHHYPEMKEGELTRLRSALVRTEQLATFARFINLGDAMRLGKGEAEGGGRRKKAMLCGTFEALIGALYLDVGLEEVQRFIEPMLEKAVKKIIAAQKDQDPKSMLQEWVQSHGISPPSYETISTSGPEHNKTFEVIVLIDGKTQGSGKGFSKQAAAKEAAKEALKKIEII